MRRLTSVGAVLVAGLVAASGCGSGSGSNGGGGTTTGGTGGTATGGTGGHTAGTGGAVTGGTGGGTGGAVTGGTGAATACAPGGPGTVDPAPCDPDPLRTNLPVLWNGNSVDAYDCPILQFAAQYHEPDAMIFKAILYVESRFQYDAVGCTGNGPCCPEHGWTAAECACLGPMQTGPACDGSSPLGLLPDGHVDLETDPSCADFTNSVFNPAVNIELGIAGIAGNRAQVMQQFPGCTDDQYTMMAVGNFNSYGSTQSCTAYNTNYDSAVLDAYNQYGAAAGWPAHPYVAQ